MASQDFTIETKLKIAGVVATGKLDAGTLKFNVDTSALAKLATDAKKTADKIAKHFEGIKLDKFTVDINTASLNAITKQLKTAIEAAAKQAKISVTPSITKPSKTSTKQADDIFSAPTKAASELARTIGNISSSISRLNNKLNDLASTITGITSKATSASTEKQRTVRTTAPKTFPLDPSAPVPFSGRKVGVPDRGYQDFIKKQQSLQATVNKEQLQAAKEKTKSAEKESKSVTNLSPKMAKLGEAIDQAKTVINSFKTQLNPLASESGAFSKIGANAKLVNDGMNSIKASITNLVRSFSTLAGANEQQKKTRKPKWSDFGGYGSTIPDKTKQMDQTKAEQKPSGPLQALTANVKLASDAFRILNTSVTNANTTLESKLGSKLTKLNLSINSTKDSLGQLNTKVTNLAADGGPLTKLASSVVSVNDGMKNLKVLLANMNAVLGGMVGAPQKQKKARKPNWADFGGYGSTLDTPKPDKDPKKASKSAASPLSQLSTLAKDLAKSFTTLVGKSGLPLMAETVKSINQGLGVFSSGLAKVTGATQNAADAQQAATKKTPLENFNSLLKQANGGLKGLIKTLAKVANINLGKGGARGGTGPQTLDEINASLGGILPASAKMGSVTEIMEEAKKPKPKTSFLFGENDFSELVDYEKRQRIAAAEAAEAAYSKVEKARLRRLRQLQKEVDTLGAKERDLISKMSGSKIGDIGAGYFGGGYVPGMSKYNLAERYKNVDKPSAVKPLSRKESIARALPYSGPDLGVIYAGMAPQMMLGYKTRGATPLDRGPTPGPIAAGYRSNIPPIPPGGVGKKIDPFIQQVVEQLARKPLLLPEVAGPSVTGPAKPAPSGPKIASLSNFTAPGMSAQIFERFREIMRPKEEAAKIEAVSRGARGPMVTPQYTPGPSRASDLRELKQYGSILKAIVQESVQQVQKIQKNQRTVLESPMQSLAELREVGLKQLKVMRQTVEPLLLPYEAGPSNFAPKVARPSNITAPGISPKTFDRFRDIMRPKEEAERLRRRQEDTTPLVTPEYQPNRTPVIDLGSVKTLFSNLQDIFRSPELKATAQRDKLDAALAGKPYGMEKIPSPSNEINKVIKQAVDAVVTGVNRIAPAVNTASKDISDSSNRLQVTLSRSGGAIVKAMAQPEIIKNADFRVLGSSGAADRPIGRIITGGQGVDRGGGAGGGGGGGGGGGFAMPGGSGRGGASNISALAEAMEKLTKNTKKANEEMTELENLSYTVGRKAAAFRGIAMALNTIVSGAQNAIKFVADFSDSMLELNKILQISQSNLEVVGSKIINLSRSTGVAVADVTEIATEFARAGLQGRGFGDVISLTEKALLGMQGTSLTASQSTEILIQTIQQVEGGARGLNKELITSTKLFDILGRAEDITASKATDVQDAFKRSLGSLTATGASMEELVTIVSVVEERTQRGGDVIGTAFKTLASRIGNSSSESAQALKAIGVETTDSQGRLRSIFDVLRETSIAFQGLSEAEQANIAVKVAGVRQVEIFRAALSNFARIQEVNTQLTNAAGDAERKRAIEQQKVSTKIQQIISSLQQLAKQAADSKLGDIFVSAIEGTQKLVGGIADLDKKFGNLFSIFTAGFATVMGMRLIKPIILGMYKAFKFFVDDTEKAGGGIKTLDQAIGKAGNSVKTNLNTGLESTAAIILKLNAEMDKFNQQQELAATKAKRLALAEETAVRNLQSRNIFNPSKKQIFQETQLVLGREDMRLQAARSAALGTMANERGGAASLRQAIGQAPEQFSEAERRMYGGAAFAGPQAAANPNRLPASPNFQYREDRKIIPVTGTLTKLGNALNSIRKPLDFLSSHPIMTGVGFSVLGATLTTMGEKTKSTGMKIAGSALQFASFGAALGPWGMAIGAVTGAAVELFKALGKVELTVESLTEEYSKLGLVQTENGQVTIDAAQQIEKAFNNIKKLRDYGLNAPGQKDTAALEESRKAFIAGFQRNATPEVQQQQTMAALSEAFKAAGGGAIDFTDPTLTQRGSKAAGRLFHIEDTLKVALEGLFSSSQEYAEAIGIMASMTRDAAQKAKEDPYKLEEEVGKFQESLRETVGRDIPLVATEFETVLMKLSEGIFDTETQQNYERLTKKVGYIPGQNNLTYADGTAIAESLQPDKRKALAEEARQLGLRRQNTPEAMQGAGMQDFLKQLPLLLQQSARSEQNRAALEITRSNEERQRAAFGRTGTMFNDVNSIVSRLGKPVSDLEVALRDFTSSFSTEIMKLKEVTAIAATPEKEIAARNVQIAQESFKVAQREADFTRTDASVQLQKVVSEMEGLSRSIIRDEKGNLLPQYEALQQEYTKQAQAKNAINMALGLPFQPTQMPQEQIAKLDVVKQFTTTLVSTMQDAISGGVSSPDQIRQMMRERQPSLNLEAISDEELKQLFEKSQALFKADIEARTKVEQTRINLNKALVDQLRFTLDQEAEQLDLNKRRYEVSALLRRASIEELTGIRQVVGARQAESEEMMFNIGQSESRVESLNKLIDAEKAILKQDGNNVASKNKMVILEKELNNEMVSLNRMRAEEMIANERAIIAAAQQVLQAGQREADYQKSLISARGDLNDSLLVGERSIERFNRKLEQNAQSFRQTQATLASEIAIINATVVNQAEKEAQLDDVRKRAAAAALEAAKAEAQIIAERRQAVQQITQELLSNQQEQVSAQKAVIDATQAVSDAYMSYVEAVQGSIMATTQYNLGVKMAQVETVKLTGGFSGIREQLGVVISTFREAESTARQLGANEKTLVDIRRQSIEQQLSLFNELLTQQSGMARQFFQSSAEDQAAMFLGIQEAGGIAEMLGGSFENFRKLGESSINQLGAQLLALPQETRQRIVSSLETLQGLGGTVGGFTASELLTAIETASLGVSGELQVDPLFEVQQRIADLTEQQARLATEQLITSQQAVDQSKQQLEEAQAAKDLAEIQLERIKEEGNQLRAKLGEVNGDLRTVILQQNATSATGFNSVTSIIGRTNYILENTLPSVFSTSVAQAMSNALQTAGLAIPGLSTPMARSTPEDRGNAMASNLRQMGSNQALQTQVANMAGPAPAIMSNAFGNTQQTQSNVPGSNSSQEANTRLNDILQVLQALSTTTTNNGQVLTEIRDRSGNAVGTAAANIGGTAEAPEITININGEQRVTVTGFEAGVSRIAQGLAETFGGFATEQEARNIAQEVVETIRTELQRLGLLQRNQF